MEEITENLNQTPEACQSLFSSSGRLTRALPGFVARAAQVEMAVAVADTIERHQTLVVEAGTGTGKTYAYLVPSLLSRKRIILSTATKTLQDQLVQKDLPTLIRALGLSVRVQNLKGRANYVCRYRTQLCADEGRFVSAKLAHELINVFEALPRLNSGERGELPHIPEDSPVWPYVTSTTENCLGGDCPSYQECFLVKARRRAMESDVVVINHHLFFADSKLKDEGFGEILPNAQVVIFDEAHQLADIAANFSGERGSTRQVRDLMDDLLREWPPLALANQPLQEKSLNLDRIIDALQLAFPQGEDKLLWEQLGRQSPFMTCWHTMVEFLLELSQEFEPIGHELTSGLTRCQERLQSLIKSLQHYTTAPLSGTIQWVERFKHSLAWHITPIGVHESFQSHLNREKQAYIFTSATLAVAGKFQSFTEQLGLLDANTLCLESPFDFKTQAMLYLPRGIPDPKNADYYDHLIQKVLPVINACGGRTFLLFTSYRGLNYVASKLRGHLKYPLLVQGEESKRILLERFREAGNAVLLGTATFWEGVDVKGEALSCVIIDKLPFASPMDPIIQGKMAHYERQGMSSFHALSLPEAIIALKQGVGRLIRDSADTGVLVIVDPRLTSRDYGRDIFESLPKLPKTRCSKKVLDFINQMKNNYEVTCD